MTKKQTLTKGQRTRQKIIKSAINLFAINGFSSTSIQMIADECGLSQSAVFQHFSNKNQLLDQVRSYVTESNHSFIDKKFSPQQSALEAIEAHSVGNIQWGLKYRAEAQIILLTYYFGSFDSHFQTITNSAIDLGQFRLRALILSAQREGSISIDKDPLLLAEQLHDMLFGIFFKVLASNRSKRMDSKLETRIIKSVHSLISI